MKPTGHSGMYLPGEVLNFVWHVDFLKYYYLKFYVWRKKGTKASKLEMAEYRQTNGVSEKELFRKSWLFWSQRSFVVFFCTLVPSLKLPGMPTLALLLLVGASWKMYLNHGSPGYGPHFPMLSLPAATDCSAFTFLAVQESSFGSTDEIALFKYLPARYIAPGNQA